MQRILPIFLVIMLIPSIALALSLPLLGGHGPWYPDIILWTGFETAGTTLETSNCNTGTDTSWTLADGATISTDLPYTTYGGTYSLDVVCDNDATADVVALTITSGDYFNSTKGAIVCAFRIHVWDAGQRIWRVQDAANDDSIVLEMTGTDELHIEYDTTETCITTAANIAVDTWYWTVYVWDSAANTQTLAVYNTSGTLLNSDDDATDIADLADISTDGVFRIGGSNISSTAEFFVDQFVVFDGSVTRTAAQYLGIVRERSSCPR